MSIKALPSAGNGDLLPKKNMHDGLGFRDGYCLCDHSVCAVGDERD
jgi:hypothetical protein